MSVQSHSLVAGGVTKTLAEWGITGCQVSITAQGQDSMSVSVPSRAGAGPLWPYHEPVDLLDPDGVRRFRGYLLTPALQIPGRSGIDRYTFLGPWQKFLDKVTYVQTANYTVDPAANNFNLAQGPTSDCILSRDLLTGTKIALSAQIQSALDYAISLGADLFYELITLPLLTLPEDNQGDRTCAEVVRSCLRYCPTLSSYWNYTGVVPILRFGDALGGFLQRAGADGPETVDVLAAPSWAPDARFAGAIDWKARPDMMAQSYSILYVQEFDVETGGGVVKYDQLTVDTAGAANGSFGSLASTVRLRGPIWNGNEYTPPEPIPTGLARAMYAAFATMQYELRFATEAEEVDWVHAPGGQWNVANDAPELATAASICQTITRTLETGRVEYVTGPPAHIDLGSLRALTLPNRLRRRPQTAGDCQYGFGKPDNKPDKATESTVIIGLVEQHDHTLGAKRLTMDVKVLNDYTGA
jgi:hypothetical protein